MEGIKKKMQILVIRKNDFGYEATTLDVRDDLFVEYETSGFSVAGTAKDIIDEVREFVGEPAKRIIGKNKAHDTNGNPVYKVFYMDGSNEIVRGGIAYAMHGNYDKYYKSLSGLYNSKYCGEN